MGAEIEILVVNRRDTNDAHKNDIESIGKSLWVFFFFGVFGKLELSPATKWR